MATYVKLLGRASVVYKEARLEPPAGKTSALLYSLAYREGWVSRDELVFLFWPDSTEEKARRNLRRLLTSVRKLPYTDALETEPTRLRWPVETDVRAFKQGLSEGHTARAFELYEGPLLQGFSLSQAPEFESWLEQERGDLHKVWRDAVLALTAELCKTKRYPEANEVLEKLRRADPFDEKALRRHLEVLYLSGQRREALETFATFRQSLGDEFGGEPEHSTFLVARSGAEALEKSPAPTPTLKRHRPVLPVPPTPFVGRAAERVALTTALGDPACRLLTVVGAGGMGKTRLALAVAEAQRENFNDGVYFVPFAPVGSPELMVYALADAVGFTFFGQLEPKTQLFDYLQNKYMLLVLDNLEHLLAGATLLSSLSAHAPDLKILATSRERLNLQAERVFDLFGLSVPEAAGGEVETSDAVKVFVQTARRVRADFVLDETTTPTVVRVCQLVQGMPLALELAASWLRALPLDDVAAELARGSDLETSKRDLPERHRSLRAVFDSSWHLLTPAEQVALRKLSVFRGGFRREAAAAVAAVGVSVLAGLVDKSFLTMTSTGRYRRHPLMLQYMQEKLAQQPREQAEVAEKHSLYYLQHLQKREADLLTFQRKKALERVEEEVPNLRLAWTWAVENERLEEIKAAALALGGFFENRNLEGEAFFAQAAAALDEANPAHRAALGYALIQQAGFWRSLRRPGSRRAVERGLAYLRPLGEPRGVVRGLASLGWIAYFGGDTEEAAALFQEGMALARRYHPLAVGEFATGLFVVEQHAGNFEQVTRAFEAILADLQASGDLVNTLFLKQQFGVYLALNARAEEGAKLLLESLHLARDLAFRWREPWILNDLATAALELGDLERTEALSKENLALADALGVKGPDFAAFWKLGRVATLRGDDTQAKRYLSQSLTIAWANDNVFHTLWLLTHFAELSAAQGQVNRAAERLGLVRYQLGRLHAKKAPEVLHGKLKRDLEGLLEVLKNQMAPEVLGEALERGARLNLAEVVAELLDTKAALP